MKSAAKNIASQIIRAIESRIEPDESVSVYTGDVAVKNASAEYVVSHNVLASSHVGSDRFESFESDLVAEDIRAQVWSKGGNELPNLSDAVNAEIQKYIGHVIG